VHHVRSPTGWVNDPNGPVRWQGRYHLFFQHNPAGPVHGAIHWGHASSADLARWRAEPVALTPTPGGPDAAGCWSGCVVDDAGAATAVYTGLADDDSMSATVCLATATDGDLHHWEKRADPVAAPPPGLAGYRDPFVFHVGARRYAVVGAGYAGRADHEGGVVLLYGCDDLTDWTYLGPLLDADHPGVAGLAEAEIWECPNLVEVDGRWVLVLSLVTGDSLTRVAYLVGALESAGDGLRFEPAGGGLLDYGHDCYAPALLVDGDRVLMWGWSWEDRDDATVLASGWAGALTWPRVLRLTGAGRVVTSPAPEVETLRAASTRAGSGPGPVHAQAPLRADVEVTLRLGAGPATVELAGAGGLRVVVDREGAEVHRSVRTAYRRDWPTRGPREPGPAARVRLVLDGSLAEVYVEDGPTFTERVAPGDGPWTVEVTGAAGAEVVVHELA
jgi:beta-fructofuranosidase